MIEFELVGDPVPQGSLKARCVKGEYARAYYENNAAVTAYRRDLGILARAAGARSAVGCVRVEVEFHMGRKKGHFGTGRNAGIVKESAPLYPGTRPDLDKLVRCVGDALSGIAWGDDSQVVEWKASKLWADQTGPRTVVRIRTVNE